LVNHNKNKGVVLESNDDRGEIRLLQQVTAGDEVSEKKKEEEELPPLPRVFK
jgi:hypothetical protein